MLYPPEIVKRPQLCLSTQKCQSACSTTQTCQDHPASTLFPEQTVLDSKARSSARRATACRSRFHVILYDRATAARAHTCRCPSTMDKRPACKASSSTPAQKHAETTYPARKAADACNDEGSSPAPAFAAPQSTVDSAVMPPTAQATYRCRQHISLAMP
jgi:hypothetical protein